MIREETIIRLNNLIYKIKKYGTVALTSSDLETLEIIAHHIERKVKAYTTDELANEVMKREGIFVTSKIKLDDGAVG